ncbi:MAG: hypothetical protein R3C61_20140 [Bacteroidia bacterium]
MKSKHNQTDVPGGQMSNPHDRFLSTPSTILKKFWARWKAPFTGTFCPTPARNPSPGGYPLC